MTPWQCVCYVWDPAPPSLFVFLLALFLLSFPLLKSFCFMPSLCIPLGFCYYWPLYLAHIQTSWKGGLDEVIQPPCIQKSTGQSFLSDLLLGCWSAYCSYLFGQVSTSGPTSCDQSSRATGAESRQLILENPSKARLALVPKVS